ncbi:MAG: GIY-YIG nuclease family protein [Desulfuromonadales bacterium]|nr:GIY-YIG nuclease family protein [Desulfuromonadales bacterium]
MKFVYLLQSVSHPEQHYTGLTTDVDKRLVAHNSGQSAHTAKYRPWQMVTYVAFTNILKATEFEKYLKSGSGRAFAQKHLW